MEWYFALFIYIILGGAIGFVGAMVGIGGGLIAIPILALIFDMPQQLAQGTGLVMIVSNVFFSLINYNKNNKIDFKSVSLTVVFNMLVSHWAAELVQNVNPVLLRQLFAVFLAIIASLYLYQTLPKYRKTKRETITIGLPTYALLGIFSGFVGGVFGVGGSLVVVPVLTMFYGYRQVIAQGIALSMIVPGSIVALMTYSWHGNTDWLAGIALAFGGFLMVKHGVRLTLLLPEIILKRTFAGVLFLTVFLLIFK